MQGSTLFITIIGILGAIAIIFLVIRIYNEIVEKKNAVERGWAGVVTQERQKSKILPNLERIVDEHKNFESDLLTEITRVRSNIDSLDERKVDPSELKAIESSMADVMGKINITMEAYPELKTMQVMQSLMREISEQQENVGAAIRIFNQNVEAFNTSIESFPGNIVNAWFNKEARMLVFSDSESEQAFEYKPNF